MAEFNEVVTPERAKQFKDNFADVYFFCAYWCMYEIARWSNNTYGTQQRITHYFEQGGHHQKKLERAYDILLEDDFLKSVFKLWLSPTFAPKDVQPCLQIADKILYEGVKRSSHHLDNSPPEKHSITVNGIKRWKIRYPVERLNEGSLDLNFRLFTKEQIEEEFCKLESKAV